MLEVSKLHRYPYFANVFLLINLLCLCLLFGVSATANTRFGDAYALAGSNPCTWSMGTAGIEKVVTFSNGKFELTSFKNKNSKQVREYVQGGVASPEFRFTWDGEILTGITGGWQCTGGASTLTEKGGQQVLQVDVKLARPQLNVTKHYIIFPSNSVIQEWTDYTNTGPNSHNLATPSFSEHHLMSQDVTSAQVQLYYMSGAKCCTSEAWTLRTTPLTSAYARIFDSYDNFGCVDSGATSAICTQKSFMETSASYIPWFSLFDQTNKNGVMLSFDYFGRWKAMIGNINGGVSLSLNIPNYTSDVNQGKTVASPQSMVMTYANDLEDMTERILEWQYQYLWDYTKPGTLGAVKAPGDWCTGTQWCKQWDQQGIRFKIFSLADRERAIGIDTDWRDNGWWDKAGDWNGPDFKLTRDYLDKSGITSLIYYPAYGANTDSVMYDQHKSWFSSESPCGYTKRIVDLSNEKAEAWMKNLLVGRAQLWGDYVWRNDMCPVANVSGAIQLSQDQAFRRTVKHFLDYVPNGSFFAVNSGGNEIGFDYVRLASHAQHFDTPGVEAHYDASRLFPVDKLSGDPNAWSKQGYCTTALWSSLIMNPSFYSSAYGYPGQTWHGDTSDPAQLECARKIIETYHYLLANGVAGRWVRQYHPASSDNSRNWFERLSWDRIKGTISYLGADVTSPVTVYPKALMPETTYDVRYQFNSGSIQQTGADLMKRGITFTAGLKQGDIIYLNLPKHPGSGLDKIAPTAPSSVTATAATNVNYHGVEVKWVAGSDDNWVSYYNIYRSDTLIGRVSKGTFYFDHTPAASIDVVYGVQSVDGDGNLSAISQSIPPAGIARDVPIDDASSNGITYSGKWLHLTAEHGAYEGTVSSSTDPKATAVIPFTASAVTLYVKFGPDEGKAEIKIDGALDAIIDLYAPDSNNHSIPVYSKTWTETGRHVLSVTPTGTKNLKSSGTAVYIDGLQICTPSPKQVFENNNNLLEYSGNGWSHQSQVASGASNYDVHRSSTEDDAAELAFTGSRVSLTGQYDIASGMADIYIDGKFETRIDTYGNRGEQVRRTILFDKSWALPGRHSIKVVVLGRKNLDSEGTAVSIDTFRVS